MTLKTGGNKNTNSLAVVTAEATMSDGAIAETLIVADESRIFFSVTITEKDAFIRLYPAATDNTIRGVKVKKDQTWEMPTDNIYTGEISIIANKVTEEPHYFVTSY